METDFPEDVMHAGRTIVNSRIVAFTKEAVFAAFATPQLLKEWWGPNGFTNTFHEFEFSPGGDWLFTMHSPDGANYDNLCRFAEIKPCERVVIDHIEPVHTFRLTVDITRTGMGTEIQFRMTFAMADEYERVKEFVQVANEQNLDRLEAVLQNANAVK